MIMNNNNTLMLDVYVHLTKEYTSPNICRAIKLGEKLFFHALRPGNTYKYYVEIGASPCVSKKVRCRLNRTAELWNGAVEGYESACYVNPTEAGLTAEL